MVRPTPLVPVSRFWIVNVVPMSDPDFESFYLGVINRGFELSYVKAIDPGFEFCLKAINPVFYGTRFNTVDSLIARS